MDFTSSQERLQYLHGEHVTPALVFAVKQQILQAVCHRLDSQGFGSASLREKNLTKYHKSCLKKSNACHLPSEFFFLVFGTYEKHHQLMPKLNPDGRHLKLCSSGDIKLQHTLADMAEILHFKMSEIEKCGCSTAIFNDQRFKNRLTQNGVTSRVSEQFHLALLVMSNYSHHIHIIIFLLYHMICPYISGCYIDISYQYCIFMINKCSCLNADVNCTI